MRVARLVLVAAGSASAAYGAFLVLTTMPPPQLLALVVWLAAVVVVHDGLVAPGASALRTGWRRGAERRPPAVTAVVELGVTVGGALSLFVLPEIWAQGLGNPNPTILVGDYAMRLLIAWAVIGAIVLVVSRLVIRRGRR